jgi:hypothetical protein
VPAAYRAVSAPWSTRKKAAEVMALDRRADFAAWPTERFASSLPAWVAAERDVHLPAS